MKNAILSVLIVAFLAAVGHAFAPVSPSARSGTSLNAFIKGKKLDISSNAYARGGKPSWVFEDETIYVEEPKKPGNKKVASKKTTAKKAVKKEAKFESFAPSTWKFN